MIHQTPSGLWSDAYTAEATRRPIEDMSAAVYPHDRNLRVVRVHRGGMGEVLICETRPKAEGEETHRFALKTFQKRFFFEFHFRAAFLQEAATWARLTGCLHVMPALGLMTFDQRPCVKMVALERVEDRPLTVRDMLDSGAIAPEDVLAVALQTALGMRGAGQCIPGLIHGDLKPDNLLITPNTVWISDFGVTRVFSADKRSLPLDSTWPYQAPEVFDDPSAATPSADIYAFGIMLYELLTGRLPFQAQGREGWAEAHRRIQLPRPRPPRQGFGGFWVRQPIELADALSRLAIACAAKTPQNRPSDFAEVYNTLCEIAHEHNPVGLLERLMAGHEMRAFLEDLRVRAAPHLVHALFDLEEPRLALEFIESLGEVNLSPNLLHLKGTALSILRREDEALACFSQVLQNCDLPEAQSISTRIEQALALKRLERFDEAIEIFERLLRSADEVDLPQIVINLATVHLQAGDDAAAVRLLRPFCRSQPDHAYAWANLGIALARMGEAEQALEVLDRALAVQPSLGEVYVTRAAVLMDLMGRRDLAYVSLDMAFDQGFESREWLVRFVTAARGAGRDREAEITLTSARKNLGDRLADEIIAEIGQLTADLDAKEPPREPCYKHCLRRRRTGDGTEKGRDTTKRLDRQPAAPAGGAQPRGGFRMPFINTRIYEFDGTYSLDFYYPTESADYAEMFRQAHIDVRRQFAEQGGGAHLRASRFFLTVCPTCEVEVLTNRDVGKALHCRRCETQYPAEPIENSEAVAVIDQIDKLLGRTEWDGARQYAAVALQMPTSDQDNELTSICLEAGFNPLAERSPLAIFLQSAGEQRGIFDAKLPVLGYLSQQPLAGTYTEALPPEVDTLIRRLRDIGRTLASFSLCFDERDPRLEFELHPERLTERIAELERICSTSSDVEDLQALTELLRMTGRHAEAVVHARTVVSLHPGKARSLSTLGSLELGLGNTKAAIEAYTRALRIDPADALTMFFLAQAYNSAGDARSAAHWLSRSQSLGGPYHALQRKILSPL